MARQSGSLCLSILVILCATIQSSHGLRILGVFPLEGYCNFAMGESLMRALAERGHQVDVYSHFPLEMPAANYTDYSLADAMPKTADNETFGFVKKAQRLEVAMNGMMGEAVNTQCRILKHPIFQKLIKNPPTNPPYDVVITELYANPCFLAFGRHLDLPLVGVVSTNLPLWLHDPLGDPHNLAVDISIYSVTSISMTFYGRFENFLFGKYIKHSFNNHAQGQDVYVEKYFGPGYPSVVEMQKDLDLVLVNYHHALNGIRAYAPAIVPVGGLHIVDTNETLPPDVQRFLDESTHGFIYVSFGSKIRIETFPRSVLDAFYGAFKNIAPIRVLMKITRPEFLPDGLPSNVMTQPWLAQHAVLKHKNIKAFVTHGGVLSTQEAIYFGVPMIGIPLYADQPFNIFNYVRKNISLELGWETMTAQELTAYIKHIMQTPLYKESIDKVGKAFRDNPMNPRDKAVYWVEYIARHGKNALRSPVVDMTWWQASLSDVYALLIVIPLLLLYVIKKMCEYIF